MTPLERMKALSDDGLNASDIEVTDREEAVMNLKDELLALWQSVQIETDWIGTTPHPDILAALEALNAKAAEVLK